MGPTSSWGPGSVREDADGSAGMFSRIVAQPGEVIRGQDPDGVVTVGRDLAGDVVEVRLTEGWRTRTTAHTLGDLVVRAHQASGLEYLRRQMAAAQGDEPSVPIPRPEAPPVAAPATFSMDEMLEALAAQREEQPRVDAARAQLLAPREIRDVEGWVTASVVGETIQSFEIDPDRLRFAPDPGVEQTFVRLYARAAAEAAQAEQGLEHEFPATARLARMAAATELHHAGGRA